MRNGKYTLIVPPKDYPGMRYRSKYAYEHIIVWWQNTGKIPTKGFEIHHLDMNHRNNDISNLQMLKTKEHRILHGKLLKKEPIRIECSNCKKLISIPMRNYRFKNKNGQRYFFCSTKCQALKQHAFGGRLR